MLSRICSPAFKLSLYSSPVVVYILVLNEISQIYETFREAFFLSPFKRVIPFFDISESLPDLYVVFLLISFNEGIVVLLKGAVFLIAYLCKNDVWLRGEAIVNAHAIKQEVVLILFLALAAFVYLILLHRTLLYQNTHLSRGFAFLMLHSL
jgi:hypothetical protein